jgi:hypothetical protein
MYGVNRFFNTRWYLKITAAAMVLTHIIICTAKEKLMFLTTTLSFPYMQEERCGNNTDKWFKRRFHWLRQYFGDFNLYTHSNRLPITVEVTNSIATAPNII